MKSYKTDVAVIGSGPAGASAAFLAAQGGAGVLLIEKSESPGGFSQGGNGVFAAGTKAQSAMNIDFTVEDAYRAFMEHCQYKADGRVVSEFVKRSSETVEWLEAAGIKFKPPVAYHLGAPFSWHCRESNGPPMLTPVYETMKKRFGDRVIFLLNTTAEKLVQDGAGAICGIIARSKDGGKINIECRAAVIATGGYSANPDMVSELTQYTLGEGTFGFSSPVQTGEGYRMAMEAGATRDDTMLETYACMMPPGGGPGGVNSNMVILLQPMLSVNVNGGRFMDESVKLNFGNACNAVSRQPGHCVFNLFDSNILDYYGNNHLEYHFGNPDCPDKDTLESFMNGEIAKGYEHFFIADSIKELAEKTGIDPAGLKTTIEEYNLACENRCDDVFMKDAKYLIPLKGPHYYAGRFFIGIYNSMGGIKINYKTEVLKPDGRPIPGLYAAGNDANSMFGGTFPFTYAGAGSSFSYTSGRLAGENAARYIAGRRIARDIHFTK